MSVRRYRCENRGLVIDRDENSAANIYQRFPAWSGHTFSRVCSVLRER